MISKASSNEVIAFSTSIMVLILAYDVLRKDPSNHGRSALMRAIDEIESEILEINERGIILDQASSLLKLAREEGWKNTLNGSKRLDSVRREIDSALALDEDLIELRSVVKPLVDRATGIAPEVDEPANLLSGGTMNVLWALSERLRHITDPLRFLQPGFVITGNQQLKHYTRLSPSKADMNRHRARPSKA